MKIGQIEIDLISTLQEYKVKDTEGLQGDQVHVTNTRYNKSKREKSITGSSDQYSNYRILSKPRSKETHSNARHITEAECQLINQSKELQFFKPLNVSINPKQILTVRDRYNITSPVYYEDNLDHVKPHPQTMPVSPTVSRTVTPVVSPTVSPTISPIVCSRNKKNSDNG